MKHTIVRTATARDVTELLRLFGQDDFDDHLIESVTVELRINEPIRLSITRLLEGDEPLIGPDR